MRCYATVMEYCFCCCAREGVASSVGQSSTHACIEIVLPIFENSSIGEQALRRRRRMHAVSSLGSQSLLSYFLVYTIVAGSMHTLIMVGYSHFVPTLPTHPLIPPSNSGGITGPCKPKPQIDAQAIHPRSPIRPKVTLATIPTSCSLSLSEASNDPTHIAKPYRATIPNPIPHNKQRKPQ